MIITCYDLGILSAEISKESVFKTPAENKFLIADTNQPEFKEIQPYKPGSYNVPDSKIDSWNFPLNFIKNILNQIFTFMKNAAMKGYADTQYFTNHILP